MQWEGTGGQRHLNLVEIPPSPGSTSGSQNGCPAIRPSAFPRYRALFLRRVGAWWVSSSKTYDPATTYPMTAGTFVTHHANTVHFDGANKEDGVILEVGVGPMKSTQCQTTPAACP